MYCSNQNIIRGNGDEYTFVNFISKAINEFKGKIREYHYLSLF